MAHNNPESESQLSLLAPKGSDGQSAEKIAPKPRKKGPSFRRDIQGWYDGRRQPEWSNISLNSAISWLSTLAKACILYAVSESLGQLKWVWFAQRSRPLSNLGDFDSASRGVRGSALLLWALKGRHFAVLGSMTVLMALAFEPFIQNSVQYVSRSIEDRFQVSLLGKTVQYNTVGPLMGGDLYYVDPVLKANIYSSLTNQDSTRPWAVPQYTCPTGNCTWDAMASLGFESRCTNITSYLHRNCTSLSDTNSTNNALYNCSISLPSNLGLWYIANGDAATLSVIAPESPEVGLGYRGTPFEVVQYILAAGTNANGTGGSGISSTLTETSLFTATECALVPIVQLFNASVSLSVYQESQIANWTANETDWAGISITPVIPSDTGPFSPELNQTFGFGDEAWVATSYYINNLFAGRVVAASDSFEFISAAITYAAGDTLEAIFYGNFTATGCMADDPLTCAMGNVAAAMTKTMRDDAFSTAVGFDKDEDVHSQQAVGHTHVTVLFVEIRWVWLALPVAVWLLGAVSCIGAAWKSYRAGTRPWMTSPLPLVLMEKCWQDRDSNGEGNGVEMANLKASSPGQDPETHALLGGDDSLNDYEHRARQISAKLDIDNGRFALVR
ncbi:hypothetical protein BO94DRAFT_568556 [Aspergillus sclerotioniger CBS 115572]|uniref:Uncharacterized protein n=1 Tax=Aspergillus sclerotioniger CBS 115572 TaxID=1450535 RepID=A0A317VTD2_9EURO|nr:hypothetical protein BO94DRAFT_568556 [Aspergillus sclerotioniger CBS 115572]PWY75190.1 hypothetical protein BO94DRAFT_568556 [Aspergillus sclerotioniger CBS 115572]